ncbi:hypothetical protein CEXT_792091 [Caerostris extrusa]|uniref:Uncharacterized protein n=1 Tax=Caerostris extrusa TaxID=172846 RepID=A0AAV4TEZ2_CAEEX|nr:hypothetical protein CEXT_792091 [Caerostris extrusa]
MADDKSRLEIKSTPLSSHQPILFLLQKHSILPFQKICSRTFHKGGREAIDYFSECLSLVTTQHPLPKYLPTKFQNRTKDFAVPIPDRFVFLLQIPHTHQNWDENRLTANDKSRLEIMPLPPPLSTPNDSFPSSKVFHPSFFRKSVIRTFHKVRSDAIHYFSECLLQTTIQTLPLEDNYPFSGHGPISYLGTHFLTLIGQPSIWEWDCDDVQHSK